MVKVSINEIKRFAWEQMDSMWHNQSPFKTRDMVCFTYKNYIVVNPWMNEKTTQKVNPFTYYGRKKTNDFITKAINRFEKQKEKVE